MQSCRQLHCIEGLASAGRCVNTFAACILIEKYAKAEDQQVLGNHSGKPEKEAADTPKQLRDYCFFRKGSEQICFMTAWQSCI